MPVPLTVPARAPGDVLLATLLMGDEGDDGLRGSQTPYTHLEGHPQHTNGVSFD